jgi:VWFA-related protein
LTPEIIQINLIKEMFRVKMSGRSIRTIPLIVLSLFVAIKTNGQQQFPPEHHKITVRLKLLDVVVADRKGNFVPGLTARDFEVYEDGHPRPIQAVELVTLKTAGQLPAMNRAAGTQASSRLARRLWVLFDSLNTETALMRRACTGLKETLLKLLGEGYELTLVEFDYEAGPRSLTEFTSDPAVVLKALETVGGSLQATFLKRSSSEEWKKFPESLEDRRIALLPDELERLQWRNLLQKTLSCLLTSLLEIKEYPGRKTVLFISSGLPEQESNPYFNSTGLRNLKFFDPFGLVKSDDYSEIIREIVNLANSGQISIYCYNPESTTEVMKSLALSHLSAGTGGQQFSRTTGETEILNKVKAETEQYYEIAYIPASREEDGKFHRVEVVARKEGLKVRSRTGYVEYSAREIEKRQLAASFFSPEFYRDINFDLKLTAWPEKKNTYKVWGCLKIPLAGFKREKNTGEKVDFLLGVKELKSEKTHLGQEILDLGEDLRANRPFSAYYFITSKIKIRPGRYETVATLKTQDGKIGSREIWLELPELKKNQDSQIVNLIPGRLIEGKRGKPFTFDERGLLNLGSKVFIPWAADEIPAGSVLAILVQAYLAAPERWQPEFWLEGPDGKFPLQAGLIDKNWNRKTGCISMVYACKPGNIPPGEYRLSIKGGVPFTVDREPSIKLKILQ